LPVSGFGHASRKPGVFSSANSRPLNRRVLYLQAPAPVKQGYFPRLPKSCPLFGNSRAIREDSTNI